MGITIKKYMNKKVTAVILAGGKGERFWPKSRKQCPKQFLSLTADNKTLIQLTAERLRRLVAVEDIFVVTNENYVGLVHEQLPFIVRENIIAEPTSRNTAPCVALTASIIEKEYGDAIMLVLPSDHLIKSNMLYLDTMGHAIEAAENGDRLLTIGIIPTYPETGYGYVHFSDRNNGLYEVKQFIEKPPFALAKQYVESGDYLWNSGIFVWKASAILGEIKRLLPEIMSGIEVLTQSYGTATFADDLRRVFPTFPSVSIDYGVMEKAKQVWTIPANFGWDDVGNWLALERILLADEDDNVAVGNVVSVDSRDTIVHGSNKLIAIVGLESVIVVDSADAVLVCNKERTQDVRKVIEYLKKNNKVEFL
jgi:mannose-1-phosphate guanylyltransferase